jgi:DASS family divalent anion:Na+ symporter
MARRELTAMGPLGRSEWIVLAVFLVVVAGWILLGAKAAALAALGFPKAADWVVKLVGGDLTALVALIGVAALLLSKVLTWDDAVSEKAAWDVFIWYGGLVLLGSELANTPILRQFTERLAGALAGWHWLPLFVVALLIYFYAHYAFASITTHILAMFPAFVAVLKATEAPLWLVVCAFAFFANFAAGLTHYGTTPGPIIYGVGYVSQRTWWQVGFLLSLVNVTVWLLVGMAWWKLLGLW